MRVAWVHPTWRDLVIERLAADGELRHRFLGRCGPHGIALALSTSGGHEGARRLPLICDDEDWDAVGDRIYALAPELEARDVAMVLFAVDGVLEAVPDEAMLAGEAAALARMALARFDEVWSSAHTLVTLSCIDGWLSVAARLAPRPWPTFLSVTWAELLPTELPSPDDLSEVQRFTDWMTLVELAGGFSPDLLGQLGYGSAQGDLRRAFKDRERWEHERRVRVGASPVPEADIEESRAERISDHVIRRVLADL
ncbi:MAG: hypothetical protein ACRDPM_22790 [Solirubrobacteraceae bacterium]